MISYHFKPGLTYSKYRKNLVIAFGDNCPSLYTTGYYFLDIKREQWTFEDDEIPRRPASAVYSENVSETYN